jgi:hypothetical protein
VSKVILAHDLQQMVPNNYLWFEKPFQPLMLKALSNEMAANPIIFFESPPIFTAT